MEFSIEIGLIILFALLSGVLSVRFRIPTVLGLIFIGALVGNLNLIKDHKLLDIVLELGAILLLFTVGIEFNLEKLKKFGFSAIIAGIFKLGGVFFAGYFITNLLGYSNLTAIFVGSILSITSTVIFVKVLEQKNMAKRKEVPFLIAMLIIEDIFGIFLLTFFSGLNQEKVLFIEILKNLGYSFIILFIVYAVIIRFFSKIVEWMLKYSTDETTTFLAMSLLGLFVYLANYLKLSSTIGAFLAGNVIASIKEHKIFEKAIHPFLLTFTSLFFFSMGVSVDFKIIISQFWLIILLLFVLIVSVILTMSIGTYFFGNFSGKSALFSGISMIAIGEFSLLLAHLSKGLSEIDLVSITAGLIFLSTIMLNIIINCENKIYTILKKVRIFNFVFYKIKEYFICIYYIVYQSKEKKQILLKEIKRFFYLSLFFVIWLSFLFVYINYLKNDIIKFLFLLPGFILIILIILNITVFKNKFEKFYLNLIPGNLLNRRSISDLIIIIVFFVLILSSPILSFLNLPYYNIFVLILLSILLGFFIRLLRTILFIYSSCSYDFDKIIKKMKKRYN